MLMVAVIRFAEVLAMDAWYGKIGVWYGMGLVWYGYYQVALDSLAGTSVPSAADNRVHWHPYPFQLAMGLSVS